MEHEGQLGFAVDGEAAEQQEELIQISEIEFQVHYMTKVSYFDGYP